MVWTRSKQRLLLAISLAIGIFIADSTLLAPLHEWGHYFWATRIEHVNAMIVGWDETVIEKLSPHILLAGYEAEITTALLLFVIFFFISSPGHPGFRGQWWHLGFFLGYATWSWIKPLLYNVSDMVIVPAWTQGMRGTLLVTYLFPFLIAWTMLLVGRVRRPTC